MAMVTAIELNDFWSSRKSAGKAKCAHRRFGARTDEPQPLDGRHKSANQFSQFDFKLSGRAEGCSRGGSFLNGANNLWTGMSQNQRPPGTDKIDILLSININDIRSRAARDEAWKTADGLPRSHRAIHSARNFLARTLVQTC